MRNIFLYVVVVITTFSCKPKPIITIKNDHNVQKVFNSDEITSLDMIIKYFDSVIIKNTKNWNIAQAYHDYFENISTTESLQDINAYVGLANSNGTKAVIEKLKDRKVFNEIWKYSYGYQYKSGDTSSVQLSLNVQGKYFKLLKLIGKKNVFIKKYVNSVESAGCISPSLVAYVMKDYNDIDFQKPVNRLIMAVHYITFLSTESVVK